MQVDREAARSNPDILLSLISDIGAHLHRCNLPIHGDIPRACATVIKPDAYLDLLNCKSHHLGRRRTPPPRVSVEDRV